MIINKEEITYIQVVQKINILFPLLIKQVTKWILILIIIIKPISELIKVLLKKYQPKRNKNDLGVDSAGAFIGILERIFILMMLSVNQYSAIGFILTAKSIARYKKISDDVVFSEYYLLGTLLSSILVILVYRVII